MVPHVDLGRQEHVIGFGPIFRLATVMPAAVGRSHAIKPYTWGTSIKGVENLCVCVCVCVSVLDILGARRSSSVMQRFTLESLLDQSTKD